jgi:hypothetical protein
LKLQRTAVFKWIGAIVLDLGRDGLPPLAYQLLAPLARELVRTDESDSGKELCQLAKQVSDLIKKKLGMEVYMRHLSRLQINLSARRADRKKLRAQEVSLGFVRWKGLRFHQRFFLTCLSSPLIFSGLMQKSVPLLDTPDMSWCNCMMF